MYGKLYKGKNEGLIDCIKNLYVNSDNSLLFNSVRSSEVNGFYGAKIKMNFKWT